MKESTHGSGGGVMRIGEIGSAVGVDPPTIRYYESVGVLPEPERTSSGYRAYSRADVERLRFVTLARSLGLGLDDIRDILALRDRGEAPCGYVRGVLDQQGSFAGCSEWLVRCPTSGRTIRVYVTSSNPPEPLTMQTRTDTKEVTN